MRSILFSFLAVIFFLLPNTNFSRAESHKEILESFENIKIPNTDVNFGKRQSYPNQVPPIGPLMNRSLANTHRINAITKKKQIFSIFHKIHLLVLCIFFSNFNIIPIKKRCFEQDVINEQGRILAEKQ